MVQFVIQWSEFPDHEGIKGEQQNHTTKCNLETKLTFILDGSIKNHLLAFNEDKIDTTHFNGQYFFIVLHCFQVKLAAYQLGQSSTPEHRQLCRLQLTTKDYHVWYRCCYRNMR